MPCKASGFSREKEAHRCANALHQRDEVEKREIRVAKISTEHNPADMLTKPLPATKFKYCLELVKMVELATKFLKIGYPRQLKIAVGGS